MNRATRLGVLALLPALALAACESPGPQRLRLGTDSVVSETLIDGQVYGFGLLGREGIANVTVEVAEWIELPPRFDGDSLVYEWSGNQAYRVMTRIKTDGDGLWSIALGVPGEYGFRYTPAAGSPYQCTAWLHQSIGAAAPAEYWFPKNLCNFGRTPEQCVYTFRNRELRDCS